MTNSNSKIAGALASVLALLQLRINQDSDMDMAIYNNAVPEVLRLIKQYEM
ncbi:hypothetical protein [Vibrio albus]|uniref:hypothetical protein n=1 Tax=Vibrio albus TaxID=2200953 RepID=UPI0015E82D35|nr:hypothetical protein [Vibrio albus]